MVSLGRAGCLGKDEQLTSPVGQQQRNLLQQGPGWSCSGAGGRALIAVSIQGFVVELQELLIGLHLVHVTLKGNSGSLLCLSLGVLLRGPGLCTKETRTTSACRCLKADDGVLLQV